MKVENIEDSYQLSPMQQGMLFHSLYAPGSGVDIEQIVCTLHESIDALALEQAWQRVMERHPALRTSFRWEGLDQPIQDVHQHIRCSLEQRDWRGLSKREQEAQLDAYLRTERRHGFELSEAPLMRLALFQVAEADYQLIWTFHHMLLDGRSFPLVLKEVFAFYEAFCQGQDLQLECPRPYRDYIEWLQQQDVSKAEAFWRQTLKGFTTPTPLVVGKTVARSLGDEGDYGVQQIQLPKSLTSDLKSLAQRHQLTLNTLVQGTWALLLSRYSGEEDVVFGATRACRRSALEGVGTEFMVGLFINTLPVRVHVPPEMPALTCLKELRMQSLTVREYEHTPLVKIQEWSDVPRGVPLFESILVFENYPLNSALQAQGGNWVNREFRLIEQTNYPLTLLGYGGTSLLLRLRYDRRRFADATISRMLGHWQTLLQGFVANPEQRLSDLPLLTEAERHQLLVEWNNLKAAGNTGTDYPRDQCIHQLFEAQVARTPGAVAVVFGDQQLTYQELNRRANQLAYHLRALGVGPEMLVGICVERSLEMVIGLLGILKAGGAYVPLDPSYPKERLAFMLEDTHLPVLLTQERLGEKLPAHAAHVLYLDTGWEAVASESEENLASEVSADNLAYIMYTSGSTGKPKGASVIHRGVVRLVKETNYANLTAEETFLQLAPISFDASTLEIWGPLLNGGRLIVFPAHMPSLEELAQVLQQYQITTLWLTAGLFHQMVETQLESLTSVQQLLAGGDVLSVPHVRKVLEQPWKSQLINGYGPTENTTFTCCYPMTDPSQVGTTVSIGRPIAHTQVYVLDHYLHPVPTGVPGELYIGGDGLARGYWERPELTAERFVPHPFSEEPGMRLYKTGDLVRYLPNGNIEFLGRIDHQVKIRGFRVELGEIGAVLGQHPAVQEAVVLAREDVPGQKRLVAYVVPDQEQRLTISDLRGFLQAKLPDYMLPSVFVQLEAMPLTPNGKVDRRALPAPDGVRPEIAEAFVAPRTQGEALLANIWAELLGIEQVGIHDNFFELGGDSILSMQIIAKANQAGLQLTPRQIFQHQTIAELAVVAGTTPAIYAEQGLVTGPAPLTPIQCWFFEKNLPDPYHWNQAVLLEVRQSLDPALLEKVVQHLLRHHDALRLRFAQQESGWWQFNAGLDEVVPFTQVDLSALSEAEQGPAIEAAAAELQASLNLSEGPLVRVALFDLGVEKPNYLLIIIHHLVVDGVSWRILLEDLQTACQQLGRGEAIQLPAKTTSFKQWAEQLAEYARSLALEQELDYWLAEDWTQALRLPVDYPGFRESANTEASTRTVSVSLSAEETQALLHEVPVAYRTQINDVLLTALVQAFARWTGVPSLLVDLEGHGREEILEGVDLSRTVGWFTSIFPVLLHLEGVSQPGEALKSIKEQLRHVPNKGIGYGLLRYLSEGPEFAQTGTVRQKLRALPQAELSFNYLGQFDQILMEHSLFRPACECNLLGLGCEFTGSTRSLRGGRVDLIEINGSIMEGRLQLDWTYSENIHWQVTIGRLAESFMEALRALIAHCQSPEAGGYTPSDFPEAGLSQEELDNLLAELGELTR